MMTTPEPKRDAPHMANLTIMRRRTRFFLIALFCVIGLAHTAHASSQWANGSVTLVYDAAGNPKSIGSDTFLYDSVDRVTNGAVRGRAQSYTYDAFGNRLTCTDVASSSDCQLGMSILSSSNRVVDAEYDEAGNLTEFGADHYEFDRVGMLRRDVASAYVREYVYTADDERIAVVAGGEWNWTLRDFSGKVLREISSSSNHATWQWKRDHIFRNGELLASRQPFGTNTTTRHYHLDHLGTSRIVSTESAAIIGTHDYFVFGTELSGGLQEPGPARLRFTGHERDSFGSPGNELDYMHARYYSVSWGRFLSFDPEDESVNIRAPQSWNRFSYSLNNPILYVDPDGRATAIPWGGLVRTGARAAVKQVGTRVAAGSVAGPVGVAAASAGLLGWELGRAIGTSTWGGRTIDSRVTDLFVKGIELGQSLAENTAHGEDRANDDSRTVDRDKVKANGDVYIDTETGATVYVHGGQVVLENDEGALVSQWNDQTASETRKKVKEGKWVKRPKDMDEPEIQ